MVRSIGKQFVESMEVVMEKKKKATVGRIFQIFYLDILCANPCSFFIHSRFFAQRQKMFWTKEHLRLGCQFVAGQGEITGYIIQLIAALDADGPMKVVPAIGHPLLLLLLLFIYYTPGHLFVHLYNSWSRRSTERSSVWSRSVCSLVHSTSSNGPLLLYPHPRNRVWSIAMSVFLCLYVCLTVSL